MKHPICIATFLALLSATHAQNLVVNGSFETPFQTLGANYLIPSSELAPWRTDGPSFEIWAPNLTTELAADGRQHLEILGTDDSVWQTISTVPHENYVLSFSHTPRATVHSTLTVSINSRVVAILDENGSALTSFSWHSFTANFTATGNSTTIRFSDAAPTGAGTHIDNVTVVKAPPVEHAIYGTTGRQTIYGNNQITRVTTRGFVVFEPDTQRGTAITGFVLNKAKLFAVVPMQNYRVERVSGRDGATYTIVAKAESPGTQFAGTLLEAVYLRGLDSTLTLGRSGLRRLPSTFVSSGRSIAQNDQTGITAASEASGTGTLQLQASVTSNIANETFEATVARLASMFTTSGYSQITPSLAP